MSLISAIQSDGMTVEQGIICKCDQCKHRWLPTNPNPKKLPKRCAKCKSRLWNRTAEKSGPKPGTAGRPPKQGKAKHRKGR